MPVAPVAPCSVYGLEGIARAWLPAWRRHEGLAFVRTTRCTSRFWASVGASGGGGDGGVVWGRARVGGGGGVAHGGGVGDTSILVGFDDPRFAWLPWHDERWVGGVVCCVVGGFVVELLKESWLMKAR